MGLYHAIKKAIIKKLINRLLHKFKESHEAKAALGSVNPNEVGKVFAPVGGRVIDMDKIPDDIFGKGNFGPGCGIHPDADQIVSPVTGTVSATVGGAHVVGITSNDGIEVLVHVGIGEREIEDEQYSRLVEQGQRVKMAIPS